MSAKCKLVDQATFDKLQQSTSNAPQSSCHKVRNAKYKRMTANRSFDLLLFMKRKTSGDEANGIRGKRRVKKHTSDTNKVIKKKGKQRENGVKRVRSRLKKSILRCRQTKKTQQQLDETTAKLNELTVTDNDMTKVNVVKATQIHSRRFREYAQSHLIIN